MFGASGTRLEWSDTDVELRQYTEQQLHRLQRSLEDALSVGGVDTVHQVRVASRRLEEPLELCRPWARGKDINRILKRLKGMRNAFRSVRELDVLRLSLTEKSESGLLAAEVETVDTYLGAVRERKWRKASAKVARLGDNSLSRMIERVLDEVIAGKEAVRDILLARVSGLVATRAAGVLKTAEDSLASGFAIGATPDECGSGSGRKSLARASGSERGVDLHPIRLRLKRLRYVLELNLALRDQKREDPIQPLKAIQARLGDWNDQFVAARRLSKLAGRRRVMMEMPEIAAHLLTYAAGRLERARELANAAVAEWPALGRALVDLAKKPTGSV